MRNVGFARFFFAIADAGLAIYSLAYGDFAAGGTLPEWLPGHQIWSYLAAVLALAASAGLCFSRTAQASALAIGAYLAIWGVLGIPANLAKPIEWYGFCEALSSLTAAWILYATIRSAMQRPAISMAGTASVRVAQALFGLTCIFYGWSHFVFADYTATMVPAWLPGRLGIAYFTGAGHIAAGIGLVIGVLPRLAGTLEAIMMSLFSLLVWVPSFFAEPRPAWATPSENQWSEFVVTVALTAAAWVVAASLQDRSWGFGGSRGRAATANGPT